MPKTEDDGTRALECRRMNKSYFGNNVNMCPSNYTYLLNEKIGKINIRV
jgi:hypothetical protein